MATPSPLQETKMVVPSDPNGQQFNLPGEAGELPTVEREKNEKRSDNFLSVAGAFGSHLTDVFVAGSCLCGWGPS